MSGPWGEWTWVVAIAIKAAVFVGICLGLVGVRYLAIGIFKVMPDCRLKRALFATHGDVRRAWRSYPANVGSNCPDGRTSLLDWKAGDE